MNILKQKPPEAVRINGKIYPVSWGFRTGIKIMAAMEDSELAFHEKQWIMLRLFYGEDIPPDTEKAIDGALKFLDCGAGKEKSYGEYGGDRLFSWEQDAAYIYSGIAGSHNVDLCSDREIHWWVFVSLFMDMREDCMFCRLVDLRKRKKSGKLSKEEKMWWAKNRDIAEIGKKRSCAEEAAVMEFVKAMAPEL